MMIATTVAIMMETTMASKEQLQLAGGHYLLWTSPLIFVSETATTMMKRWLNRLFLDRLALP